MGSTTSAHRRDALLHDGPCRPATAIAAEPRQLLPNTGVRPFVEYLIRVTLDYRRLAPATAGLKRKASVVKGVDQFRRRRRLRQDADPPEWIIALIGGAHAVTGYSAVRCREIHHSRRRSRRRSPAPAVVREPHRRRRGVDVMHIGALTPQTGWPAGGQTACDQVLDDLLLPVDRDARPTIWRKSKAQSAGDIQANAAMVHRLGAIDRRRPSRSSDRPPMFDHPGANAVLDSRCRDVR